MLLLWLGWRRLFFEPSGKRWSAYTKNARNASHAGAFMISPDNFIFLFLGVAWHGLQNRVLVTSFTPILLLPLSIMPILDNVRALTIATCVDDYFLYHTTQFTTSLAFFPLPKEQGLLTTGYDTQSHRFFPENNLHCGNLRDALCKVTQYFTRQQ